MGSIPFGYLAGRVKGVDLREHGSRNIGATNAMRVLGKAWGIPVFLLDFVKGYLPALLWWRYGAADAGEWLRYGGLVLVSLATILGHTYTCFLQFKGGKGVATTAGVLMSISPMVAVTAFSCWAVALVLTRYVSVASIVAALTMVVAALYDYGYFTVSGWFLRADVLVIVFLVLVAVLVIYKHKGNIERVLAGTEPKAFSKK